MADKLMAVPGNVRGAVILATLEYLRRKEGEQAIDKIKKRLKQLGYPFLLGEIKAMEWYPEALSVLIILLCREIFGWTQKEVFQLGKAAPKLSFLFKALIKYFIVPKQYFKEAPNYWKEHFDFGKLVPVEFDGAKKKAVIRIEGYEFHPIICAYHRGYLLQFCQLILGKKNVKVKERKCQFKGDSCHEYEIYW